MREIDVTDDDIENGLASTNHACAVARAMKRAYGHDNISVVLSTCIMSGVIRQLPNSVTEKIYEIGRYKVGKGPKPKPFTFMF